MKTLFLLFSLVASIVLHGQDAAELERRNGFKEIKLGSPIDSVKGATFKKDLIERKEFETKLYETEDPQYMSIGGVEVRKIELKVYKGLIYEIHVVTAKDQRVMPALEKSFGKATYSIQVKSYYWKAESLSLVFKGLSKEINLTYRSAPVIRMMYEDKGKKIETISEDF